MGWLSRKDLRHKNERMQSRLPRQLPVSSKSLKFQYCKSLQGEISLAATTALSKDSEQSISAPSSLDVQLRQKETSDQPSNWVAIILYTLLYYSLHK